jgi:hypothetical protein
LIRAANGRAIQAIIRYHAFRHWSFYVGIRLRLESHGNFFLIEAGAEYGFEITENFEIALSLAHENKEGVYDSWTFGVAFNKKRWSEK